VCCFFFFKQKTAYEMVTSDWSSDVCSSDLLHPEVEIGTVAGMRQATIPLPRGSETITRLLLTDLLDELDKRFPPVIPGQSTEGR